MDPKVGYGSTKGSEDCLPVGSMVSFDSALALVPMITASASSMYWFDERDVRLIVHM